MRISIKLATLYILIFLLASSAFMVGCVSGIETDTPDVADQEATPPSAQPTPEEREILEDELRQPEETVIAFLEKLGYQRSYLIADFQEEKYTDERNMWTIGVKDGFDELCYASLPDPPDRMIFIKFVVPPGDISPETVRPGQDIAERIARALGLYDQGYVLPEWNSNPNISEFRKYASFPEYEICTGWVVIFTDPANFSLQAIHFADSVIPANPVINIERDTAVGSARTELGDPSVEIAHTELLNRSDILFPPGELGIFWEVVFVNGNTISVNAADGTVSRATPMY